MIRLASSTLTPSSRLSEPESSAKGPPITNVPFSIRASMNSACDQDILLGCGGARILDRAPEAFGDEGERGPSFHHERLACVVGKDEDGLVKRWVVSPPAVRVGVVLPGPFAAAEHSSAHHDGAGRAQRFRDELVVRSGLSAGEAVGLAPALERKDPLVQLVSPLAKRILECRARPGDVAVERDRNFRDDLAHLSSYEVSVAAA